MNPEKFRLLFTPIHSLSSLINLKTSLYVIAFQFPIIKNFLPYSTSSATYSLNNENGGLVTTMSASFRRLMHSSLRKSPSPLRSRGLTFAGAGGRLVLCSPWDLK